MSVIKSKRGIAGSEFVNTARELHKFSYQKCSKFPKSQTFRYGQMIVNAVDQILTSAQRADRTHIYTKHDAQDRLDAIRDALAACDTLDSAIEESADVCSIPYKVIERWAELLDTEERLLCGQREYCYSKLNELKEIAKVR